MALSSGLELSYKFQPASLLGRASKLSSKKNCTVQTTNKQENRGKIVPFNYALTHDKVELKQCHLPIVENDII